MSFTYNDYRKLMTLLRDNGYAFANYHNFAEHKRCVIMRHDVDNSLPQAVRMAELEAENGVQSTFFVLLRTDFYNVASASAQKMLRRILALGHEIGLHFDEKAYEGGDAEDMIRRILREKDILSALLDTEVTTVSMHRPSKAALEANEKIPGMVNSYGEVFFHNFKYMSDSRRRWREPVESIICAGEHDRLHILTHPFWYHNDEESIAESVGAFVRSARHERYLQMAENITDIDSIIKEENI